MSEDVQSPKQPLPHRALEVPGAYLVIAGSSVIDSSLALGSFRAREVRPLSLRILGGKHATNPPQRNFCLQLLKPGKLIVPSICEVGVPLLKMFASPASTRWEASVCTVRPPPVASFIGME